MVPPPHPSLFVAVGSSLGDRRALVAFAARALAARPGLQVLAGSRLYDTAPMGGVAQARFLNGVLQLTADPTWEPEALLEALLHIEAEAGRTRTLRWEDRLLDLDLLLWGSLRLHTQRLVLPHPALHERWFVLQPLADLAPDLRHPTLDRTVAELLAALPPGQGKGTPLPPEDHPDGWPPLPDRP